MHIMILRWRSSEGEPSNRRKKSFFDNGARDLRFPGSENLEAGYTGGIDWKVQLISMPSFFKRYQRAT